MDLQSLIVCDPTRVDRFVILNEAFAKDVGNFGQRTADVSGEAVSSICSDGERVAAGNAATVREWWWQRNAPTSTIVLPNIYIELTCAASKAAPVTRSLLISRRKAPAR
jgi:hypothetical protein